MRRFHLLDGQFKVLRFEDKKKFSKWKERKEQIHDCLFALGSSQDGQHFYYCYSNESVAKQLDDDSCPSYLVVRKGRDGFFEVEYLDFHSHANGKLNGPKKGEILEDEDEEELDEPQSDDLDLEDDSDELDEFDMEDDSDQLDKLDALSEISDLDED